MSIMRTYYDFPDADEPDMRRKASELDVYIGAKIREARQDVDLTQGDLANKCALSFQQIQKYETGKNRVSASMLFKISRILGKCVSWFFPGDNKMKGF